MINLFPVPYDDWQHKFDVVTKDPYISKKYDRNKRLQNKSIYIKKNFKDVDFKGAMVLDIGPGPGEFMEICRELGANVFGIDAPIMFSEMGNEYMTLSKLMVDRQQLDVKYIGLETLLKKEDKLPYPDNYFRIINSQGAIEQVFRDYLEGIPHRVKKDKNLTSWVIDDKLENILTLFFTEILRTLEPKGICLIYGNGAKNVKEYDKLIKKIVGNIDGLALIYSKKHRLHKVRRS